MGLFHVRGHMANWLASLIKFISPAEAQRAHISLLEAQKRELESPVENQAKNIGELRAENGDIKEQNKLHHQEIQAIAHKERIEELRETILVIVANNERLYDADIGSLAGVTKQIATLHLHELRALKFVDSQPIIQQFGFADIWTIEQPGRKYLSQNGLL